MTYNIHHAEGTDGKVDIDRIAKLIRQADPDIVALQDVDRGVGRSHTIDMMTSLCDRTGLTYAFGKTSDIEEGENGNGVLTRFPILQEKNIRFPENGSKEAIGLMALVLDVNGSEFALLNTRLVFGEGDTSANAIAEEIVSLAKQFAPMPTVLCGDFDLPNESQSSDRVRKIFDDAWPVSGSGHGFTFPSTMPSRRVDYIFVSRSVPPTDSKTLQIAIRSEKAVVHASSASDHLPVQADIRFVTE